MHFCSMKKAHLKVIRDTHTLTSSVGKLYINGKYFCHTLEDVARAEGVKIPGHTAIPTGTYAVQLSMSSRFGRIMPMIYNQENGYELRNKGVSFKGVRLHGGNTHKNTEGCILVAYNRLSDDLIQGTAEKDLTEKLKEYDEITIAIESK